MNILVTDSEYCWADGLARTNDDGSERIPHPPNAVIESLAFVLMRASETESLTIRMGVVSAPNEEQRIRRFLAGWMMNERPSVVTFNGRRADVPLIVARCIHHRIVAREFIVEIGLANRYTGKHIDLADELGGYGAQLSGKLDEWAQCIGWPGKLGVDGSQVAGLIQAGKRAEVDAYCLCDTVQTAALVLRMYHARGKLSDGQYQEAATLLLREAQREPMTAEMARRVDVDRWLGPVSEAA